MRACCTRSLMSGLAVDLMVEFCQFFAFSPASWTVLLSKPEWGAPLPDYFNLFRLLSMMCTQSFFPADSCTFDSFLLLGWPLCVRVSQEGLLLTKDCLSFWLVRMLGISQSSPIYSWQVSTDSLSNSYPFLYWGFTWLTFLDICYLISLCCCCFLSFYLMALMREQSSSSLHSLGSWLGQGFLDSLDFICLRRWGMLCLPCPLLNETSSFLSEVALGSWEGLRDFRLYMLLYQTLIYLILASQACRQCWEQDRVSTTTGSMYTLTTPCSLTPTFFSSSSKCTPRDTRQFLREKSALSRASGVMSILRVALKTWARLQGTVSQYSRYCELSCVLRSLPIFLSPTRFWWQSRVSSWIYSPLSCRLRLVLAKGRSGWICSGNGQA